jgi:hypothetical protein
MKKKSITKAKKGEFNHLKPVEGQVLTEEQIKLWVIHFNERGNFPGFKIPCSKTGKLSTCVGPWKDKKIAEFGSAENLLRNYVSRSANKTLKTAVIRSIGTNGRVGRKKKEKTVEQLREEKIRKSIPQLKETVRGPLSGPELIESTRSACQRPDIFLDNGRNCNGCEFYGICENSLKTLPDFVDYVDGQFVNVEGKRKRR